jgi:hypothetical protein
MGSQINKFFLVQNKIIQTLNFAQSLYFHLDTCYFFRPLTVPLILMASCIGHRTCLCWQAPDIRHTKLSHNQFPKELVVVCSDANLLQRH